MEKIDKPPMTEDEMYGKWWFRYPSAFVSFGIAWWLYDSRPPEFDTKCHFEA